MRDSLFNSRASIKQKSVNTFQENRGGKTNNIEVYGDLSALT